MRPCKPGPRQLVVTVAAAALLATTVLAAAADDGSPTTADPHEAGTASEQVLSLARELALVSRKHGTDAVALQASLLVQTLRAGALAPSEVGVLGPSEQAGPAYLRIRVATGLIFDSASASPPSCREFIWNEVAAPVLAKMGSFEIEPAGLELVFSYGLQNFAAQRGRKASAAEPYTTATLRVVIDAEILARLSSGEISTDDILAVARIEDGDHDPSPAPHDQAP